MNTSVPRQSKQTWIPVPVAKAQMTRPLTVRELLARQAAKEIPKGSLTRGVTTHCIEVTPGKGGFHHRDWRARAHHHGHGSTEGTNGALKQNGDG